MFTDEEVKGAPQKLDALAQLTKAKISQLESGFEPIREHLDLVTGRFGVSFPSRYRMIQDYYWILDEVWFYLLILALPLEVVVRRWSQLTSIRKKGAISG